MFLVTRDGVLGDVEVVLKKLRSLQTDLELIAQGHCPGPELDSAPFLDNYCISIRGSAHLIGEVQGHPLVKGRRILTSAVWAYSPQLGWARTWSRFYRLGRPAELSGGTA